MHPGQLGAAQEQGQVAYMPLAGKVPVVTVKKQVGPPPKLKCNQLMKPGQGAALSGTILEAAAGTGGTAAGAATGTVAASTGAAGFATAVGMRGGAGDTGLTLHCKGINPLAAARGRLGGLRVGQVLTSGSMDSECC